MDANDDVVKVGWEFELDALRQELKDAGSVTDREVKKLTDGLKKRFQEIDDAAVKAAKDLSKDFAKAFDDANKEVERAAQKHAQELEQLAQQAEREWEKGLESVKGGAEKVARMIGGPFGEASEMVLKLGTKLEGAAGAAGVAGVSIGAVALAWSAGAVAAKELADAAVEARDRLKEQGEAAGLPKEALDGLEQYESATKDLRTEVDKLTVEFGGPLAGELANVAEALVGAIEEFRSFRDGITATEQGFADLTGAGDAVIANAHEMEHAVGELATAFITLGLSVPTKVMWDHFEAVGDLKEKTRELNKELDAQSAAYENQQQILKDSALQKAADEAANDLDMMEQLGMVVDDEANAEAYRKHKLEEAHKAEKDREAAVKASAEALKAAHKADQDYVDGLNAAREALEAIAKDQQELKDISDDAASDTVGSEEKIQAAYDERIKKIDEIVARTHDQDGAQQARDEAEMRRQRDLDALAESRRQAMDDEIRQQEQLNSDCDDLEKTVDKLDKHFSAAGMAVQVWGQQLNNVLDSASVQALGDLASQLAQSFMDANQAEIEMLDQRHQKQLQQYQEERDQRKKLTDETLQGEQDHIDAMLQAGVISDKEADLERKNALQKYNQQRKLDRQADADAAALLKAKHDRERKAALDAFHATQRIERGEAVIDAATAGISLIPAFSYLGPGAPAAAALVAGAGLALALQKINSEKPPELPTGFVPDASNRSPDHPQAALLQDGEAVASRRGVANLGGYDRVRRANQGMRSSGGTYVQVLLGHRELAMAYADVNGTARPDSRMGKTDPWRR